MFDPEAVSGDDLIEPMRDSMRPVRIAFSTTGRITG